MKLRANTLPHYFEEIKSGKKKFDYRHIESITFVNTETGEEYTCEIALIEKIPMIPAEVHESIVKSHLDCNFAHNKALYEIKLGDRTNEDIKCLGECIGQTIEGDCASGVWLILAKHVPEIIKAKYSRPFSHPDFEKLEVSTKACLWRILCRSEPATELMRFTNAREGYNNLSILTTQDGKIVGVNSEILDYFSNYIKDFRVEISPDDEFLEIKNKAIKIFSGDSLAGIIMPMNLDYLPDKIKDKISVARDFCRVVQSGRED